MSHKYHLYADDTQLYISFTLQIQLLHLKFSPILSLVYFLTMICLDHYIWISLDHVGCFLWGNYGELRYSIRFKCVSWLLASSGWYQHPPWCRLQTDNEWADTSLRYRHWRMCFERLLQAFARWQHGNLFDIAAQPILEYRWIASYTQPSLRTQFKVATAYSIHTQSLSWCSTGLVLWI